MNLNEALYIGNNNKINVETLTIEGDHNSICIKNDDLYVDGKPVDSKYKVVKVIVNGNVKNVDGTSIEINGDVSNNVDGSIITVRGNVGGSIDGTNVTVAGSVNGDIDATFVNR
jgi:hypothetical protein